MYSKIAIAALLCLAATVNATPTCPDNVGISVVRDHDANGDLEDATLSMAAMSEFVGSLGTVSTQNFNNVARGSANGRTFSLGNGFGTFTTSGHVSISGNALWARKDPTITFSKPQQAIGFYIHDAGNGWRGSTLRITCASGNTQEYNVQLDEARGGNIAYFSSVRSSDPADHCVKIEFDSSHTTDFYFIDDLTVGSCVVPEPECEDGMTLAVDENWDGTLSGAPNTLAAYNAFINSLPVYGTTSLDEVSHHSRDFDIPGISAGTVSGDVVRVGSILTFSDTAIEFDVPQQAVGFVLAGAGQASLFGIISVAGAVKVTCANGDVQYYSIPGTTLFNANFMSITSTSSDQSTWCKKIEFDPELNIDLFGIFSLVAGRCTLEEPPIVICECAAVDCGCQTPAPVQSGTNCLKLRFEDPADEDNLDCTPRPCF